MIFVNLKNLSFGKSGDHVQLHNALCTMQKVIFRQQGTLSVVLALAASFVPSVTTINLSNQASFDSFWSTIRARC